MNIFTHFFSKYFNAQTSTIDIDRDLIQAESNIGRELFGPIPKGVKREFFCLNDTTWVWHEEVNGKVQVTHYLIKPNEILKSVNNGNYQRLSLEEAERFYKATQIYSHKVTNELYAHLGAA